MSNVKNHTWWKHGDPEVETRSELRRLLSEDAWMTEATSRVHNRWKLLAGRVTNYLEITTWPCVGIGVNTGRLADICRLYSHRA